MKVIWASKEPLEGRERESTWEAHANEGVLECSDFESREKEGM